MSVRSKLLRAATEHQIQASFVQEMRWLTPRYPALKLAFAIPNGGHRNPITGAKLKAEGVRTGMPDWCLPVPSGKWSGLWIEFKRTITALRGDQASVVSLLRMYGHYVEVCDDPEAARKLVCRYLIEPDSLRL